jgi:hypothetical protein
MINASLHHINHQENLVVSKAIEEAGDRLTEYVDKLLKEISTSSRKRDFRFRSENTEVRAAIPFLFGEDFHANAEKIARRLLSKEIIAQAEVAKLNVEIQKGSLFQATLELDDGSKQVVISKADHSTILDETDFELHHGLPWNKKTFKAMSAVFRDGKIEFASVYDTNPEMTKYWWYDFLELEKIYDEVHNTKKSLDTLQTKLFNPIKANHRVDYNILRNTTIGYFRTKKEFDIEDFVSSVLENYQTHDPNLEIGKLVEKARTFPQKYKFDQRFSISAENINKRITNQVFPLRPDLELVLKSPVDNLSDLVTRKRDAEGRPYVMINVDETGYSQFPDETSRDA